MLFWEGEAAWQAEEYADAERAWRELVEREPDTPWRAQALYRLAWAEDRRGAHEPALERFAEAGRLDPALAPSAGLQRGWAALALGRVADAATMFADVARRQAAGPAAQEALIGQAECAYREGDFAGAGKLFDAALALSADAKSRAAIRYSLAWTAYRQRQPARARGEFLAVEREFPSEPAAPFAAYRAALCLLELEKPDEALVALREVQARYPRHLAGEWAAYSRGWIHLTAGRFNEAKAAFRALLDEYPAGSLVAPAKYLFASTMFSERRFADSEREFASFAERHADSGLADGALLWAGWSALLDGRPRDALAFVDRFTAAYPASAWKPDAALAAGEAHFLLHDYDRAAASYVAAAEDKGDARLRGLAGLGWCAFATEDWKGAEKWVRTLAGEAPAGKARLRARVRLGDALFNQKRFAEASADYRATLAGEEEPLARWAQLQLGWCAFREDRPDDARREWEQLRRRWPRSPEAPLALNAVAETLFNQERFVEAEQDFRRLAKEVPADSPLGESAALRLGDCLYNAKSYEAAVLAYREFSRRYPKSARLAEALYGMQWAYMQLGQYEQARREAVAFLAAYPQASLAAEVQLMVAESFMREKKPAEAVAQFRDLVEKYPQSDLAVSALIKLGEAHEVLGEFKEAEAAYADFLAKHPTHVQAPEATFRLAVARFGGGNVEGAREVFTRVAAAPADPHAAEALYNLVLCGKKLKREDDMLAALKRLESGFPKTRAAFSARLVTAYALGAAGKAGEAAALVGAVADGPFDDLGAEAAFALGEAAAVAGDKAKALERYGRGAAALPKGGEWAVQSAFAAADLLAAEGKHAEAIEMFRKVLEKEDASPEWMATAYFGIASRYEALGKPSQAKLMYKECVKRNPPPALKARA
ncbi:MAG: tetratricopeptide repeat protein, partial [bacterium]